MTRTITNFNEFSQLAIERLHAFKATINASSKFEHQYVSHCVDTYLEVLILAPKALRNDVVSITKLAILTSKLDTISPSYLPQAFLPQSTRQGTELVFSKASAELLKLLDMLLGQLQQAVIDNPTAILSVKEAERLDRTREKITTKLKVIETYHQENAMAEELDRQLLAITNHKDPPDEQLAMIEKSLQLLANCPISIRRTHCEPLPTEEPTNPSKFIRKNSSFKRFVEKHQSTQVANEHLELLLKEDNKTQVDLHPQLVILARSIQIAIHHVRQEVTNTPEHVTRLTKFSKNLYDICQTRNFILQTLPSLKTRIHCQQLDCELKAQQLTPWTQQLLGAFFKVQLLVLHAIPRNLQIQEFFKKAESWVIMTAVSMHPLLQKQQHHILQTNLEKLDPLLRGILSIIMNDTSDFLGEQAAKAAFVFASTFNLSTLPDCEYKKNKKSAIKSKLSEAARALTHNKKTSYTLESTQYIGVALAIDDPLAELCWDTQREVFQLMRKMSLDLTHETAAPILQLYTELGNSLAMLALILSADQQYTLRLQHTQNMLTVIYKLLTSLAIYAKSDQSAEHLLAHGHKFMLKLQLTEALVPIPVPQKQKEKKFAKLFKPSSFKRQADASQEAGAADDLPKKATQ